MHELTDWRARANCRNTDPEQMQPEEATEAEVALAKRVCNGCPVRAECRELANSQAEAYGIHDGEWFGRPPLGPDAPECEWCQSRMPEGRTARGGSPARFCSQKCRYAAHYARKKAGAA
jgi:hypothetical protein